MTGLLVNNELGRM